MQNKSLVLRSLLWKDAKTITPLLIMAVVGIVLFNVVALIGSMFSNSGPRSDTFLMVWVLMPNLVALGAPALLVGGEEESGTLGWLRTLPVRWQSIVNAKFLVATASVLLTWLAASLGLAIALSTGDASSHSNLHELMTLLGVSKLLFFSALLLSLSFVCAYGFRSPIVALLVLVPLITAIYLPAVSFGEYLLSHRAAKRFFGEAYSYNAPTSNALWAAVIFLAVGLLVAFWLLHRWLGHRRLTKPTGQKTLSASIAESIEQPYRPPMMHNMQRPSPMRALLWQQYRQIGWLVIALTAIGVFAALSTQLTHNHFWINSLQAFVEIFSIFGIPIAGLGLGAIVFYGDSVNRRLAFFADRGISPGKIWWTRMLLPLAACLVITIVAAMDRSNSNRHLVLIVPGLFACGQVVSMWMSRPILSIFAAPVYATLLAIPLMLFFDYYQGYSWTSVIGIPVLLLATWWSCKRWLAGDTGKPFHTRMVAMTALAILLPLVSVLTYRVATTPTLNKTWRAQAMAETIGTQISRSYTTHGIHNAIFFTNQWGTRSATDYRERYDSDGLERIYDSLEDLDKAVESEIESESNDAIVTNDDIAMIFDAVSSAWDISRQEQIALRHKTMKLVLTRVDRMRQSAIAGWTDLDDLHAIAEVTETGAVRVLLAEPELFGKAADVRELVALVSSDQLRRESRIKTLLAEWRRYQPDYPRTIQTATGIELPRLFLGMQLSSPGILGIEQSRSDRYLDEFVGVLWEQLRSGLPNRYSPAYNHRVELWQNAISPGFSRWNYPGSAFDSWTREHEMSVEKLRERYDIE